MKHTITTDSPSAESHARPALSKAFAKALSKALLGDPHLGEKLSKIQGSFFLELTDWGIEVVCWVESGVFQSLARSEYEQRFPDAMPSVSVSGTVPDFLSLMQRNPSTAIRAQVEIRGDVHVLMQYQTFFKAWKLDLSHVIAEVLGEGPARWLSPPLKKIHTFLETQHKERLEDLKEWIFEEKRFFVSAKELDAFYQDIKTLQLRVDRFEARLNALKINN